MVNEKIINFQNMKTPNLVYSLAGLYPGMKASKVLLTYHWLSDFLISCVLLATIYQLLNRPSGKKESLSVSLVVTIAYTLALYYSLCFRLQYQKIVEMKKLLENVSSSLARVINEEAVIKATRHDIKLHHIYVISGVFTAFMSAVLFSIQPLLRSYGVFGKDGQKVLQIDTWCPYECHVTITFEITVVLQFITTFWVALRFFANDSFYMFAIKLNIQYFKLLMYLGENILNLELSQQSLNSELSHGLKNERQLNLLKPLGRNESHLLEFNEKARKLASEKLKVFIEHHQLILRCANHTCKVYGPVMVLYLLSLIGFLSVGAFGVINTNGFKGVQSVAVTLFSIVNLTCMYFMSEAGDQLAFVVIKTLVSLYLFMVEVQGVKKS